MKQSIIYGLIVPLIAALTLTAQAAGTAYASDGGLYTVVRPGVNAGTGTADFYADIFAPLAQNPNYVFFAEPRFRINPGRSDENEFNVGLGYRRLVSNGGWYVGGNVFYDTMESPNNFRYDQVGVGLEARSMWLDIMANGYIQAGDTKNRLKADDRYGLGNSSLMRADGYEEAMSGMDGEVGVLVPGISDFVETRLYAGGYWWLSDIADDVAGVRARVQIDPIPLITVNGSYSYDDVRKSVWRADAYLNIPFEVTNIFDGRCPLERLKESFAFGKGARGASARMSDRVERDRYIQSEKVRGKINSIHDMIYVDNSNDTGVEDGSLQHPFSSLANVQDHISSDLPNVSNLPYIYVFEGVGPYTGEFDLSAGMTTQTRNAVLWGEHYALPGMAAGGYPVIEGGEYGVVFNGGHGLGDFTLRGISITGTDNGGVFAGFARDTVICDNVISDCGGPGLFVDTFGENVEVYNNTVYNNNVGMIVDFAGNFYLVPTLPDLPFTDPDINGFNVDIHDNNIIGNFNSGLILSSRWDAVGPGGPNRYAEPDPDPVFTVDNYYTFNVRVTGNTITGNGEAQAPVIGDNYYFPDPQPGPGMSIGLFNNIALTDVYLDISGNVVTDNMADNAVLQIYNSRTGNIDVRVHGNEMNGALDGDGFTSGIYGIDNISLNLANNIFGGAAFDLSVEIANDGDEAGDDIHLSGTGNTYDTIDKNLDVNAGAVFDTLE